MQEIIELYRRALIQLATPHSMGTGVGLAAHGLVATNEHIVRDNREVAIQGHGIARQLARVVYLDPFYDLAFLAPAMPLAELPPLVLKQRQSLVVGQPVWAMGHPFGMKFSFSQGVLTDPHHHQNDLNYLQHTATLNPGHSGGPLVDNTGALIGINAFDMGAGRNIGFALPVDYLETALADYFAGKGAAGARCFSCRKVTFEPSPNPGYCPNCGAGLALPTDVAPYEPTGIQYTIEQLLQEMGHPPALARLGPNHWEITKGSALIQLAYHEESGFVTADAQLCTLPGENLPALYEYLLGQNYREEGVSLSIKGRDIVLSLLIQDRYLNLDTSRRLFLHLFERADYYDNILVETFGARWKGLSEEEE